MKKEIEKAIQEQFGCTFAELSIKSRKRIFSEPRAIACYLLRKHTQMTLEEIAQTFNRNHASVVYNVKLIKEWMLFDYKFYIIVKYLEERINESRIA